MIATSLCAVEEKTPPPAGGDSEGEEDLLGYKPSLMNTELCWLASYPHTTLK